MKSLPLSRMNVTRFEQIYICADIVTVFLYLYMIVKTAYIHSVFYVEMDIVLNMKCAEEKNEHYDF